MTPALFLVRTPEGKFTCVRTLFEEGAPPDETDITKKQSDTLIFCMYPCVVEDVLRFFELLCFDAWLFKLVATKTKRCVAPFFLGVQIR